MFKPKEPGSFYSHFAGALLSVAGTIYLLVMSRNDTQKFITLFIYGVCMILLFTASSLYHALKGKENGDSNLRKLDHLAIFFMIAGTYTPVCAEYLTGGWRTGIIMAQWLLVLFGIFFKFFYISAPRYLSTGIYVLMGWLAIIPMHKLIISMPAVMLILILAGGLSFTAGAVIYAAKRPDPFPGKFGFHEIFHLFILLGAALQYLGILFLL